MYILSRFVQGWEVHACGQAEGVGVEHRIVGVEEVVHPVEHIGADVVRVVRGDRVRRCEWLVLRWRHRRLHALALHRLGRRERLWVRTGPSRLIAGLVIEHIGLLIVLLLYNTESV